MILRSLDFKLHRAVNLGKQGVVTTHTDVVAGVELRTTLTNNDAASIDSCITKNLHTKTLSLGVTTVAGRTAALFMCHFLTLLEKSKLSRDRVDLELRVVLTMTSALDGVLATTHLEDANLVVTAVRNNRGRNAGAFNEGSTDLKFIAIGTAKTSERVTWEPTSAFKVSTLIVSPAATRYCFPPVLIIAYIVYYLARFAQPTHCLRNLFIVNRQDKPRLLMRGKTDYFINQLVMQINLQHAPKESAITRKIYV